MTDVQQARGGVQTVKLCPRWVAPNLLTFVGFIFCFGHFGLLALYDYDFSAATYPAKSGQNSVPGKMKSFQKLDLGSSMTLSSGFIWVLVALFLFLAHTLDGIDGKQARRTGF